MAKISTNGDFVEDSFHIRNEFGMKVDKNQYIFINQNKAVVNKAFELAVSSKVTPAVDAKKQYNMNT